MEDKPATRLMEQFAKLEDPRIDRTKRHKLIDIVTIAICAVICGADTWVDVALFGRSKREWLEQFLELPGGVPSHDTFGRVFARLDAQQFEACFMDWVQAVNQVFQSQLVAIDGKTLRRSHDRYAGKPALHLVSAWASANRLALAQAKVEGHSNETTAIPELLRALEVSGCVITIDAMGCQKEIARTIVEEGAGYVLALKKNQAQLYADVMDTFTQERAGGFADVEHDFHETVEKGHGRIERRRCWTISDHDYLDWLHNSREWTRLKSIALVEAERHIDGKTSVETRCYISSLPGCAAELLAATRGHWGIENSVHWVLDIAFREDESRVRKGHAPQNFAILRRMALNLLKGEITSQGGVAAKRKRAGWDQDYLLLVLSQ